MIDAVWSEQKGKDASYSFGREKRVQRKVHFKKKRNGSREKHNTAGCNRIGENSIRGIPLLPGGSRPITGKGVRVLKKHGLGKKKIQKKRSRSQRGKNCTGKRGPKKVRVSLRNK